MNERRPHRTAQLLSMEKSRTLLGSSVILCHVCAVYVTMHSYGITALTMTVFLFGVREAVFIALYFIMCTYC